MPVAAVLKALGCFGVVSLIAAGASKPSKSTEPTVQVIIQKSVEANKADFRAAPEFACREMDRMADGTTKTWDDLMIDGSPYQRLIEVNGEPLSKEQAAQEEAKLQKTIRDRKAQNAGDRQQRIAKYEKDRKRDQSMMQQLTAAFNFKLTNKSTLNSRQVYVLRATPKAGYRPPNMETQVLTGMQGQMWIDTKTYQWVKVTAKVVHPVSIEGFLAQVQPGTQFELEKMPVADGVWLAKHFSMKSRAKVLYMFNHSSSEDDTYSDYKPAADLGK